MKIVQLIKDGSVEDEKGGQTEKNSKIRVKHNHINNYSKYKLSNI